MTEESVNLAKSGLLVLVGVVLGYSARLISENDELPQYPISQTEEFPSSIQSSPRRVQRQPTLQPDDLDVLRSRPGASMTGEIESSSLLAAVDAEEKDSYEEIKKKLQHLERRKRLDDKSPTFDFFESSMTRLLRNPGLALDAWEATLELREIAKERRKESEPLPSETEALDLIKKRVGEEAFNQLREVFENGPTSQEMHFTRYLYHYKRKDENGNMKPLVLRSLTELAIWFLPREVARRWRYL
jgi:hypothetical protein